MPVMIEKMEDVLNGTHTSQTSQSDIEYISQIANKLGKVEKENEDLRQQLESSTIEVDELRMEKTMSCVMCRQGTE